MKLFLPPRLSLIGYLVAAGIVGTIAVLAYQSLTAPDGSAVFPTDVTASPS